MSPPASQRAERIAHDLRIAPHVAPLLRGADGAARRPYHSMECRWDSARHIFVGDKAFCQWLPSHHFITLARVVSVR